MWICCDLLYILKTMSRISSFKGDNSLKHKFTFLINCEKNTFIRMLIFVKAFEI